MAKKVPLDGLADAIQDIMDEYADSVYAGQQKAVEYAANKGVQQLKANSGTFGGTGKYKGGWKKKVEKTNVSASATLYNAAAPGLPHLLEHGHAKVVGGRRFPDPVKGKVHIQPVQDELNETLMKQIKVEIT